MRRLTLASAGFAWLMCVCLPIAMCMVFDPSGCPEHEEIVGNALTLAALAATVG